MMGKRLELSGQRFGRLLVLGDSGKAVYGQSTWLCECDCGNLRYVIGSHLRSGHTKSCGCLQKDCVSVLRRTHGHKVGRKTSRIYNSWRGMMNRCYHNTCKQYKDYGGRGIVVCERWHVFENYYADIMDIPTGKSVDRIDNDGNYEPSNCKFSTYSEQSNNTRSSRFIEFNGVTKTVAQWAIAIGISSATIRARIDRGGWGVKHALTTPVRR